MFKLNSINHGIVLVLVLLAVSSFAGSKTKNLIKESVVTIEKTDSKNGRVTGVTVKQKGKEIIISGKVIMRTKHVRGHVDIAFISPDGDVKKTISTDAKVWRASKGRGQIAEKTAHFSIQLSMKLVKGSVVRLGFHKPSYSPANSFDCEDNVVVEPNS